MTQEEISLTPVQAITKRALDIVLAALFIVLCAPLMLAIAIAIKATSAGPAIYKYRRLGPDGNEVYVYRFRTMSISEDSEIVRQSIQTDSRITPFGAFLRRTALDELPAFFNVLSGEMSVVGPRPKHQAEYEYYSSIRDVVIHAKPGITSTSRVRYSSSSTSGVATINLLYELELEYIRNWSLWLDLKIIGQTIKRAFFSSNAY